MTLLIRLPKIHGLTAFYQSVEENSMRVALVFCVVLLGVGCLASCQIETGAGGIGGSDQDVQYWEWKERWKERTKTESDIEEARGTEDSAE